jgi:hypothetical protein
MRAKFALLLLLTAVVSCQKSLFSGTPRWMRMQDRHAYFSEDGDEEKPEKEEEAEAPAAIYVSGLRFPGGVAWRNGDYTGARLVLWKDGEEVLDLPAGHYPEPDRHRIRDGHLWWDDSDGSTTFVYRDGEEMLHYPGDEILRGLLVVDGHIHTLGQRAGSGGFSYRVDGEEVFSHPSAQVLGSFDDREWEGGALMRYGDEVCYCFTLPVRLGDDISAEYHVMKGEQLLKRFPAGTAEKLFDLRVLDGSIYRSQLSGLKSGSLTLFKDDVGQSLGIKDGVTVHLCRLVPFQTGMLVKGYSTQSGTKSYTYWLRGGNGPMQEWDSPLAVADLYVDNPDRSAIYLEGGRVQEIRDGKKNLTITPGRYLLYTPACTALVDGSLYAALSDANGNSHLVLQDGQFQSYNFNGCLTGIRIE